MRSLVALAAFLPLSLIAQRPAPRPHPLPVVGATRERFAAVDAVTIGDRIFVVERTASGGWLRVYDASDVANPFEIRAATAPIVGRPLAIAGEGRRMLVASMTDDTTRVRLTLFDVARGDRSRWVGAASLGTNAQHASVEEMEVLGDRAVVKPGNGSLILLDLAQLERAFAAATRGDETSAAARAMLRTLDAPRGLLGEDAVVPVPADSVYRDGTLELWSAWDLLMYGQLAARTARTGALVHIGGQWELDIIDAATRKIAFTTRRPNRNVESMDAPDGGDVLVNDIVRLDTLGGRRVAVFNATILGPAHREKAWEGGAFVDITDPAAPRVIAVDRRSSIDTASLHYGWRSYVRQAVFARDAIVEVDPDSTRVFRFDASGKVLEVVPTGRFAGRLVRGPDGTVLELSVGTDWGWKRPATDTTAPAVRIRTTVPRLAVRDAPAAIAVDARGATTVEQRVRFEIVTPGAASADPSRLSLGTSLALPVTRRGARLEARIPAGAVLGTSSLDLALAADGVAGRWIALAVPPTALAAGTPRAFATLDDPFSGAAIVVPDTASGAAFADVRLRARLVRDTNATVFIALGREPGDPRIVRRDRGRAEIVASRSMALATYPAPAATPAVAALRHVGSSGREQLSLCLRDLLGKRVQQQFDANIPDDLGAVPCGDGPTLRGWLAQRGVVVLEGPDAAVMVNRNHLPPVDTTVEAWRRKRWTTVRADIALDSAGGWAQPQIIGQPDSATVPGDSSLPATRPLTASERGTIARAIADAALLNIIQYAATDSSDSTVAVIRHRPSAWILPVDSSPLTVYVREDDWGSTVVGDLQDGRFVPRWEGWQYDSRIDPELIDLDGDGRPELVFSTNGTDAKGHTVSEEIWAWDINGRELTRTPVSMAWDPSQAQPISTDVEDGEYCDSDCGGFTLAPPGPDGSRSFVTRDGAWVLRDGHYVFRPNPPKPKPAPKKRPAAKRAPKKP